MGSQQSYLSRASSGNISNCWDIAASAATDKDGILAEPGATATSASSALPISAVHFSPRSSLQPFGIAGQHHEEATASTPSTSSRIARHVHACEALGGEVRTLPE